MSRRGGKGKTRPAFTETEINFLLEYLEDYSQGGHSQLARDMRLLLREYIELLVGTGMRSGTESMNIKWQHIERYTDRKTGLKYLRIWASGKTGGRHLIARARVEQALERLIVRVKDFKGLTLDEVLNRKEDRKIFVLPDGKTVKSFHTTFGWLMRASGLLKDTATGENRTLYSLRHTYATLALMSGDMDIHTLAKQMGTSVGMIERHYSKMTATLAADRLS
jgi:integrase